MFFGIIPLCMLLFVLFMRMVPVITLICLTVDKQNDSRIKKWILYVCAIAANFIVFEIVHYLLRGYVNFGATISYILTLNFTYQELLYFPVSFLACYIVSIAIGKTYCYIRKNAHNQFAYIRNQNRNVPFFFHSLIVLVCGAIGYYSFTGEERILLNEICGNNETCYLGEQYLDGYCDYIEIWNSGIFANETDKLYLSDDKDNLKKMSLENGRLEAGAYKVIGLDDNAAFQISSKGEWVYLSDDSGKVLDEVYCVGQGADTAYTRMDKYSPEWKLMKCSPGIGNELAERLVEVKEPILSANSGFYSEPFYLKMVSDEDVEIYYTLDGSRPDKDSERYSEEVYVYDRSGEENKYRSIPNAVVEWQNYEADTTLVPKAFIVRAVAIDKEGNKSNVITATYFVNNDYEGENVISLVAEPEELFGDNGICVTGKEYDEWYLNGAEGDGPVANFLKKGRKSEIEASFELFHNQSVLKQNVGLKIQGGSARSYIPEKRFTVVARKEYNGSKWLNGRLFGDYDVHSFALRPGFANAFSQYLVEDRDVAVQRSIPVVVYLNGEYWYTAYMQERYTDEYFSTHYGVDNENISIVQEGIVKGSHSEENVLRSELYSFIDEHDLADTEDYREFCDLVDIQSYIDYCCINLFLCNIDCDERQNCIMWKTNYYGENEYEDQRYRWAVYDLDGLEWDYKDWYHAKITAEKNNFAIKGPYVAATLTRGQMFTALKENPEFVRRFVLSFMDMINTDFTEEKVSGLLDEWGSSMAWNDFFFLKRKEYVLQYMAEELDLKGTAEEVCIHTNDMEAGEIILNTTKTEFIDNSWRGQYFTDYPLTLTAKAQDGYTFMGWTGDVTSDDETISYSVKEEENNIYAVFKKDS